jgi:hypothetical protein
MERECFLTVLVAVLSGVTILACGWWPGAAIDDRSALRMERRMWRGIWLPIVPALLIAAGLCGWALVEPDPVPETMPLRFLALSVLFLALFTRTVIRAGWSLFAKDGDVGAATVGFLRQWIVFPPQLARKLNDRQIEAALEHERAHARHRDPMRIWLAQFVTDLQWPWPQAQQRFRRWLTSLELARDEEARMTGVRGADLASAILTSMRLSQGAVALSPIATLMSDESVLARRVKSLLGPVVNHSEGSKRSSVAPWLLGLSLLLAIAFGSAVGERVIRSLLEIVA